MAFSSTRDTPLHERLREIDDLVRREETSRALARLNRIETRQLSEEEHLRVLLLRCWALLEEQDFNPLAAALDEADRVAPGDLEVRLLRAHRLAHLGKERQAVREAAAVARVSTVEEHAARAYMIIGLALYRTRHFSWAIRLSEKAEAFYRWSGDVLLTSWVLINLGLCYKALAQCDVALTFIRRASQSLPSQGYARVRFRCRLNEGVVLLLLGEIPLARAAFVETLQSEDEESPLHQCLSLNNVGHTFRMQGDARVALEYYARAIEIARAQGLERQLCISLFWSGEAHLDQRDWKASAAALSQAERIATRLQHGGLQQEVLRRRAELAHATGDRQSARKLVAQAWRLPKTLSQPRDRALLERTELLVRGRTITDEQLLELIGAFRRVGDRYEFSKTVLLLFEHLGGAGRRSAALAAVEMEGRYYMAAMGLRSWQKRLDAALRSFTSSPATPEEFQRNKEAFERSEIEMALARCSGVTSRAAALLGMGRNTLAQKMKSYRIDRRQFTRSRRQRG